MNVDRIAKSCIQASSLLAAIAIYQCWGEWWLMALVVAGIYPVALLFGVLAGLVLHASGTKIEDPKIHITDGDDFVVERSQEIIGKIADLEIHEWVLLKCPGKDKIVKCFYERLVDVTKEWEAPNNTWFVVEHGRILYVQPETGSTEESR